MSARLDAHVFLEQETRAMLVRLARVQPFALHETMVAAAMPSRVAQGAIEHYLAAGRCELRDRIAQFRQWLHGPGQQASAEQAHRRFVFLRLRFNAILSDFDVFADVMTQRSEHQTGPWLAGLDAVAADALNVDGVRMSAPPVICYLDRGHGAAIRRARARLPGGGESPVAIVRVPRERMIGAGIASSLVHEVGHQAAALLDLNTSLRATATESARATGGDGAAWMLWARWISEITADLWSIARVGVGSTTGLITVVSLPRAFVFRLGPEDPHPIPWVRVRLSCAIGAALYPDGQWALLDDLWRRLYPPGDDLNESVRNAIEGLERTMPAFVRLLLTHRPAALGGRSIAAALRGADRTPAALRRSYTAWRDFQTLRRAPPSLVFAVLGQARADGQITPEHESRLLGDLLTYWALQQALHTTEFATTRASVTPPAAALA